MQCDLSFLCAEAFDWSEQTLLFELVHSPLTTFTAVWPDRGDVPLRSGCPVKHDVEPGWGTETTRRKRTDASDEVKADALDCGFVAFHLRRCFGELNLLRPSGRTTPGRFSSRHTTTATSHTGRPAGFKQATPTGQTLCSASKKHTQVRKMKAHVAEKEFSCCDARSLCPLPQLAVSHCRSQPGRDTSLTTGSRLLTGPDIDAARHLWGIRDMSLTPFGSCL